MAHPVDDKQSYVVGVDFGTKSARALLVNAGTGEEISTAACMYPHGVIVDESNPDVARHHPLDYPITCISVIKEVVQNAKDAPAFSSQQVIGIGIDATASTPLPLDREGQPIAALDSMSRNRDAMAWLWKDHTAHREAREIAEAAVRLRPEYLEAVGGSYSAEWFWAKVLRCSRVAPEVFAASYSWAEVSDWLAALLCDVQNPDTMRRGTCAAGHKALFSERWGGYLDAEFLSSIDPELVRIRNTLPRRTYTVGEPAGFLSERFAGEMGLPVGIPVAVPAIDAHVGALGCGISENTMVKIIGTSGVDLVLREVEDCLPKIDGICGEVPNSIRPGYLTLEAGQSAVGDIFEWFVESNTLSGSENFSHDHLSQAADRMAPGETGLLCLDWMNGNRSVLNDARLTGLIVGLTLHTAPAEIYRSLVEATAFGARVILERLAQRKVTVERIVASGGIPGRSRFVMQIFADVLGKPIYLAGTENASALGAALSAAVVAGKAAGGHDDFGHAIEHMTAVRDDYFEPSESTRTVYDSIFRLYKDLHDSFGTKEYHQGLYHVMKELASIRDRVRRERPAQDSLLNH